MGSQLSVRTSSQLSIRRKSLTIEESRQLLRLKAAEWRAHHPSTDVDRNEKFERDKDSISEASTHEWATPPSSVGSQKKPFIGRPLELIRPMFRRKFLLIAF